MFYLKNDDMEELFRKAAENYDVDTTRASNWEAVSNALHNQPPEKGEDKKEKKKKRRFIFWWFLLFPAGWLAHNVWVKTGEQSLKKTPAVQQYQNPVAGNTNSDIEKKGKIFSIDENIDMQKDRSSTKDGNLQNDKNISSGNYIDKLNEKTDEPVKHRLNVQNNYTGNKKNVRAANKYRNQMQQQNVSFEHGGEENRTDRKILSEVQNVEIYKRNYFMTAEKLRLTIGAISIAGNSKNDTSQKKENNEAKRNIHYFYLTALAAPDLSMVKFQRISGAGSSFGLLAGYRINKRWHIEAGAFWEKKLYYTDGKYFDKSKLSQYYQNVKMLYVDGNCKMLTVPLNIRYNVIAGQNSNWFIAGGMSSYFMNQEHYDYTYQYYNEPPKTKGYTYKVLEKNWMTVININVGFEKSLWKKYHFRVEPYFRLPVSGMGTGNLSLSSGGIYLGFGRRF